MALGVNAFFADIDDGDLLAVVQQGLELSRVDGSDFGFFAVNFLHGSFLMDNRMAKIVAGNGSAHNGVRVL